MPKPPRKNGFTLVELLIVAGMLVVVGMVVYGTFASGISIWKRVIQRPVAQDVSLAFKNFSADLHNTFLMKNLKFRGGEDHVSFPAIIRFHQDDQSMDSIGYVTYSFDPKKGNLYKTQWDYSAYFSKKPGKKTLLAEGLRSVDFEYYTYEEQYKTFSWLTGWQERESSFGLETQDKLPLMVRIKITTAGKNNEKKFYNTVQIPAGCCWPFVKGGDH